jgi:hypothetical protein
MKTQDIGISINVRTILKDKETDEAVYDNV